MYSGLFHRYLVELAPDQSSVSGIAKHSLHLSPLLELRLKVVDGLKLPLNIYDRPLKILQKFFDMRY